MLPLIPIALAQSLVCYIVAIFLGLPITINIVYAVLMTIPVAILYIALGLLFGSIFNVKQVGGICGGLLTNLSAWLSGAWFDIELIGGAFQKIANILPFIHAVELEKAMISGNFTELTKHLCVVLVYAVLITICAIWLFLRQAKKQ
jgi:ABC-2 type transport system permease protein